VARAAEQREQRQFAGEDDQRASWRHASSRLSASVLHAARA
jgi:hypothetical protein